MSDTVDEVNRKALKDFDLCKQCAIIAVDEILKHEANFHCVLDGATEYWQEVKQEIEKL